MSITKVLIFSLFLWCDVIPVKVKVEEGWLQGQMLTTSTGKGQYSSFKGIPYAEPPVGKLRFKAPRPPLRWKGIRNATEHGSVCVQFEDGLSNNIIGNEDCLFLNVYSPNIDPSSLTSVMVYIHGGYYITGSGNDDLYAPDFLIDSGVVLVTINYRLDIFGFLSVNNNEAPGNAGLKDQIAALQWVKRNIRNFGGNPNCVTVFGDSAGGSSVSLHIISPAANGLFIRAIVMSGVYSNDWSIAFEPEKRAFALGRKLGTETNNTNELVQFFRNQPAEDLIRTRPELLLSDEASAALFTTLYFTPVVEKKFDEDQYLTECPASLISKRQVNRVDVLIGHTVQEGLRTASRIPDLFLKYYPNYKQLLVPLKISYYRSPKTVIKLADRIKQFYFGDKPISLMTIKELVTYYTYSHFVYDIHAYIEKLPKFPLNRRYFYGFAIYSTRNVYSKPGAKMFGIRQATHMDDLPYLFDGSGYNMTVDVKGEAYKYIQLMTTLFTNFAKCGTPTPDDSLGLIWPEYDPKRSFVLIGKTGNLSTGTVSYRKNSPIGFWRQLYSSVGIDL